MRGADLVRHRRACLVYWLLTVESFSVPHPTPASQPPAPAESPEDEGLFAPSVIQRFKSKIFVRRYTQLFFLSAKNSIASFGFCGRKNYSHVQNANKEATDQNLSRWSNPNL